jgi:hypothetical protein
VTKNDVQFQMTTKFDASGFNMFNVGPAPAQLYYGIRFQGLSFPPGTSGDMVVPEVQLPNNSPVQLNFSTTAPGARINFDCEVVPIANATKVSLPWYSINGQFFIVNVTTPECNLNNIIVAAGPNRHYYRQKNATQNFQGRFSDYTCNNGVDWSGNPNEIKLSDALDANLPHRMVLSVADLRFPPYDARRNAPAYIYVQQLTVALCKTNYQLEEYTVRSPNQQTGEVQAVLSGGSAAVLTPNVTGFPAANLGVSVMRSMNLMKLGLGGEDYVLSTQVPTFFQFLLLSSGKTTIGAFMDPTLLIQTATSIFKGVATQVLHTYTLKATNESVLGTITYPENRLQVKELSAGLMCGAFAVIAILAALEIFLRPNCVAPREPGSIAATAAVLASSPELHESLLGLGSARLSYIRSRLLRFRFQSILLTGTERTFAIQPIRQQIGQKFYQPVEPENQNMSWWKPPAVTHWFLALLVGLPLLLIALLEVFQRKSDENNGFVDVGPTSAIVLATYIPAAVAIGVAGMYSSFESMVAIFAPFATLSRRNVPASSSISMDLLSKLAPHALYLSIKKRHISVAIILLANFLGGFLTIVVSGLYSVISVQHTGTVVVQQNDLFNYNLGTLDVDDNQASAITSLIEHAGLPFPRWTHNDLVFNSLTPMNDTMADSTAQTLPIQVRIPAIRAKLNCSVVPSSTRLLSRTWSDTIDNATRAGVTMIQMAGTRSYYVPKANKKLVTVSTTLPWDCDRLESSNVTRSQWKQFFYIPDNNTPAYIGKASVMTWTSSAIYADGALDPNPNADLGSGASGVRTGGYGCPSLAVTLGTARLNSTIRSGNRTLYDYESDLATIVCYQNVEEVMTKVTFDLPGMKISHESPPVVDESTSRLLRTTSSSSTRFEFPINNVLLRLVDLFSNSTIPGPDGTNTTNNDIDTFIKGLITSSRRPSPIETISGEKNAQNLISALNILYKKYMAQAISLNMRVKSTDELSNRNGESLPSYTGGYTSVGHRKLRQNREAKLALQIMLAVMVVCAIVTRLLIRVDQVLPHNPCSIAGTATMLAGGQICSREIIPQGAEWRDDEELRKAGVFESYLFGLGWWDTREGKRFGVDVEGRKI